MESILKNIQGSRPRPNPVLYGGALQENTDQYFKPSPFHNADEVPPAPKDLFCEYGATAEVDKRPFMTPQPQVPRDPELEALNEYFNKQRVLSYVRGFSAQIVGETLSKQAEQAANSFVKDEIDRRAGIRKSVLMNAGVSEADADRQIAGETLAGINTRTMDMRDKQITDAVNLYYNINNLPPPVNQPQPLANRSTLPSAAEGAVPQAQADMPLPEEMPEPLEDEQEEDFARMGEALNQMESTIATGGAGIPAGSGGAASGFPQKEDFGRADEPGGWGNFNDAAEPMAAAQETEGQPQEDRFTKMSQDQLINFIYQRNIAIIGVTAKSNGELMTRSTLRSKPKATLIAVAQSYTERGVGAARATAETFGKPSF